jgi:hypothetical protein
MKLISSLVVACAYAQDYDFYSSGEAYRFGSIGDFSHTQQNTITPQEDFSAPPIDGGEGATTQGNSQSSHLEHGGEFDDRRRYRMYGHGGNRRYCHTTRNNRAIYNWTSHKFGGYFAEGRNFMECMGNELYCFIEERAHYGQIIGITAGCEQMMNHPSVTIQDQQALITSTYTQINAIKNHYNQEAARGGANRHGFFTYYGLGGCLAMPAQNGHHMTNDRDRPPNRGDCATPAECEIKYGASSRIGVDSPQWRASKWVNYFRNYHGGYGQNQCLRFPKQRLEDDGANTATPVVPSATSCSDNAGFAACFSSPYTGCGARIAKSHTYTSPGSLLPFGVSVCRACCVAEFFDGSDSLRFTVDGVTTNYSKGMLCNYPPDTDAIVTAQTNDQFEELIPRFDMAGAAFNAYQHPNQPDKVMGTDRDNNLFVHGSWCDEAGPARACAKVPTWTGSADNNYIWGADLSSDSAVSAMTWSYTCNQAVTTTGGMQPINSSANRDWCPGRPWLAKTAEDSRHIKPVAGTNSQAANSSTGLAAVSSVSILG